MVCVRNDGILVYAFNDSIQNTNTYVVLKEGVKLN